MTTYTLTKNDTPKFISCSKKGTPKNGTSRTSIYGSYPPGGYQTPGHYPVVIIHLKRKVKVLKSLHASSSLGNHTLTITGQQKTLQTFQSHLFKLKFIFGRRI